MSDRRTARSAMAPWAFAAMFAGLAFSVGAFGWPPAAAPVTAQTKTQDAMSDGAENVRLVGYNDLQGRTALVTTTKSDPANGNWVYGSMRRERCCNRRNSTPRASSSTGRNH